MNVTNLIFGSAQLPATTPTAGASATSPLGIDGVPLTLDLGGGEVTTAWHFSATNSRLVLVHQGHTVQPGDGGISNVVNTLISAGFDVTYQNMPGFHGNGGIASHDYSGVSNGLRYFIEPVVAVLNLLAADYDDVSMIGLSGGGWTTTVAAAVDERIKLSIPVAGSLPKRLRVSQGSIGDWEQQEVYKAADYPALYVLGATNGRRQVQVLNRNDSCCFTQAEYGLAYPAIVEWVDALAVLEGGRFAFIEDASHSTHQISQWCIDNVIWPELGGTAQPPPPPTEQTIDNGPPGAFPPGYDMTGPVNGATNPSGLFGEWGYWDVEGHDGDEYAGHYDGAVLGASWEFSVAGGTHDVSVSFVRHANRASNVQYRIFDGSTEAWSGTISQQGSGFSWVTLAQVACTTGTLRVEVEANSNTSGYVIADAARVTEV